MAHAKCAIFGVFNGPAYASQLVYYGLHAQQHRGQESAGILSMHHNEERGNMQMNVHKGFGLVLDVFDDPKILRDNLPGFAAIGHTRYSTSGSHISNNNIQPFNVSYKNGGLAICHNGNISNAASIRAKFVEQGTLFQTSSDTELILHLIAQSRKTSPIDQVLEACGQCEGSFSLVILTDTCMFAIRDPNGFRPLVLGQMGAEGTRGGPAFCLASETCAFDLIGAKYIRQIEPGEVLVLTTPGCRKGGVFQSHHLANRFGVSPCIFEYVYFSRPDSHVFGALVDSVRHASGIVLAHEHAVASHSGLDVVVVPVPDSSNTAALGFANECNRIGFKCSFALGLVRSHYIGRTFIAPNQDARELKVRCKFNTVSRVLKDKIVVLVDDSIVRGTTSSQLISMVRRAGAREVHFRVASPPVTSPCFYGMDFPSKEELLANQHDSVDAMSIALGTDSLRYLSAEGLLRATAESNPNNKTYCTACFTEEYPVPVDSELQLSFANKVQW